MNNRRRKLHTRTEDAVAYAVGALIVIFILWIVIQAIEYTASHLP